MGLSTKMVLIYKPYNNNRMVQRFILNEVSYFGPGPGKYYRKKSPVWEVVRHLS